MILGQGRPSVLGYDGSHVEDRIDGRGPVRLAVLFIKCDLAHSLQNSVANRLLGVFRDEASLGEMVAIPIDSLLWPSASVTVLVCTSAALLGLFGHSRPEYFVAGDIDVGEWQHIERMWISVTSRGEDLVVEGRAVPNQVWHPRRVNVGERTPAR